MNILKATTTPRVSMEDVTTNKNYDPSEAVLRHRALAATVKD